MRMQQEFIRRKGISHSWKSFFLLRRGTARVLSLSEHQLFQPSKRLVSPYLLSKNAHRIEGFFPIAYLYPERSVMMDSKRKKVRCSLVAVPFFLIMQIDQKMHFYFMHLYFFFTH